MNLTEKEKTEINKEVLKEMLRTMSFYRLPNLPEIRKALLDMFIAGYAFKMTEEEMSIIEEKEGGE